MSRHEIRLTMKPVPEPFARIYRARGMDVPTGHSGNSPGALIPLPLRQVHEMWAKANGYFWLPCSLCQREFGGHEIHADIPDPTKGPGWYIGICPFCTIERNQEPT